jgi:HD superfamily phosphohydrolase
MRYQEGIVAAEIFIVIWKSMYDLVYQITNSCIAEKMIEKAIILKAEDDHDFKSQLIDVKKFMELNDDHLLETLKNRKGLSAELSHGVYDNRLYSLEYDEELTAETFSLNDKFVNELKDPNGLSDNISKRLSELTRLNDYEIICDIVKSKMPETINIDQYDELSGGQIELKSRSPIIDAIKGHNKIKVYLKRNLQREFEKSFISESLKEIISEW